MAVAGVGVVGSRLIPGMVVGVTSESAEGIVVGAGGVVTDVVPTGGIGWVSGRVVCCERGG